MGEQRSKTLYVGWAMMVSFLLVLRVSIYLLLQAGAGRRHLRYWLLITSAVRFHSQGGGSSVVSQESPDQHGASEGWIAASPGAANQHPYHVASNAGPSLGSPSTHSPHLSNHSEEQTPEAASFRAQEHPYDERPSPQYGPHIRPRGQGEADHYSSVTHPAASYPTDDASASYASLYDRYVPSVISSQEDETLQRRFPLEDTREACLFRYFIEEIAHWFDLCDEDRHFQLAVPRRAHHHPHLLNAIFAVAARHLSRLPQYRTPAGILYHGQLIPNLSEHDAVEYMLKCIPALRHFHEIDDDDYRDSIIATAVILRQLEEIDEEDDDAPANVGGNHQSDDAHLHSSKVNFLPIINSVLRSSASQTLFGRRSLIQAAYWMALRQEIYHSFTRKQPPQLFPSIELWHSASKANKTVMHTIQTAKWRWEDGSEREWTRLMDQQQYLEREILANFQPIFRRAADKAKGEIFPTIWYGSNLEVTSIQQSIMAKSVLVGESPLLRRPTASRADWRKAENDVRLLLLDLCGIALCHPASPPALLNAAIGIQLYGDFFTDRYERQALRGVVEKYRDARAWPVQKLLEMFKE
ncbi:uncharacterized protein TrAFT101_002447 [Trichoderma asperellum]|uniref:uncharacterized protein n=1 Tax=Trichoderma asperellum TaxID=101201 RepID=UPI003317070A|nr:hypothetical protein TrAFT101_002447 [Trichoderma asperellum]